MIQYCEKCGQKYKFDISYLNKKYTCTCGYNILFKNCEINKMEILPKYRFNTIIYCEPYFYFGLTYIAYITLILFVIYVNSINKQQIFIIGFIILFLLSILSLKSWQYAKLASKIDKNK